MRQINSIRFLLILFLILQGMSAYAMPTTLEQPESNHEQVLLFESILTGDEVQMRDLLDTQAARSIINDRREDGWTPLGFAVVLGNPGIVTALLETGASLEVKIQGKDRAYSPFIVAAQYYRPETAQVIQVLLERFTSADYEREISQLIRLHNGTLAMQLRIIAPGVSTDPCVICQESPGTQGAVSLVNGSTLSGPVKYCSTCGKFYCAACLIDGVCPQCRSRTIVEPADRDIAFKEWNGPKARLPSELAPRSEVQARNIPPAGAPNPRDARFYRRNTGLFIGVVGFCMYVQSAHFDINYKNARIFCPGPGNLTTYTSCVSKDRERRSLEEHIHHKPINAYSTYECPRVMSGDEDALLWQQFGHIDVENGEPTPSSSVECEIVRPSENPSDGRYKFRPSKPTGWPRNVFDNWIFPLECDPVVRDRLLLCRDQESKEALPSVGTDDELPVYNESRRDPVYLPKATLSSGNSIKSFAFQMGGLITAACGWLLTVTE